MRRTLALSSLLLAAGLAHAQQTSKPDPTVVREQQRKAEAERDAAVNQQRAVESRMSQPGDTRLPAREPGSVPILSDLPILNVLFDGGTLHEYADAVQRVSKDANVNVIVSPAAAALELGPLNLKEVPTDVALRAAVLALVDPTRRVSVEQLGPKTFVIQYIPKNGASNAAGTTLTRIFDIAALINPPTESSTPAVPPEVVLSAIEAALAADPEHRNDTHVIFHQESRLLIATGRPERMEIIRELLDTLGTKRDAFAHDLRLRRHEESQVDPALVDKLRAENAELRARLDAMMVEAKRAADTISALQDRYRKLVDETHGPAR